jgi:uncharacterized protein (DUF1800 family)
MAYLDEYNSAAQKLDELLKLYAPGGDYGAGQYATIESEAKKTGAESMAADVASGMSSGTGVAGLRARLNKDVTTAKLGVEDVRTDRYGNALTGYAGLKASAAGTMAGVETAEAGRVSQEKMAADQIALEKQRIQASELGNFQQYSLGLRQMDAQTKAAKEAQSRADTEKFFSNAGYGNGSSNGSDFSIPKGIELVQHL